MALIAVEGLEADPLAAAARFYAEIAPRVAAASDAVVTLLFPPADHTHGGWRAAAVAALARASAPRRVNGLVSDSASDGREAIAATLAYLEAAPGITGQLLVLDSHGAGEVLV